MKVSSLFILLVITLAVGAYVYFGIQKPYEENLENPKLENALLPRSIDAVEEIKLQNRSISELKLYRDRGHWWIKNDIEDLANQSKISRLLKSLENLSYEKKVFEGEAFEKNKERLAEFGFEPPRAVFEIKFSDQNEPMILKLGADNPSKSGVYAIIQDKQTLYLLPNSITQYARSMKTDFREMRLIGVDSSDFLEVRVRNSKNPNKTIKLARDSKGDWQMKEPFQAPLRTSFVDSQLSKLPLVRANLFLDGSKGIPKALLENDYQVILTYKEGVQDPRTTPSSKRPHGAALVLGKEIIRDKSDTPDDPDSYRYFAGTDKTPAAEISRFHYDIVARPAEDYVEKDIFNFDTPEFKQLKLYRNGDLNLRLWKEGEAIKAQSGDKTSEVPSENFEAALDSLRSLSADEFLGSKPLPQKSMDWRFELELEDQPPQTVKIKLTQEDKIKIWSSYADFKLLYESNKLALKLGLFEFESLTKPSRTGESDE